MGWKGLKRIIYNLLFSHIMYYVYIHVYIYNIINVCTPFYLQPFVIKNKKKGTKMGEQEEKIYTKNIVYKEVIQ